MESQMSRLIAYVDELEMQNKELQKHIYNIQQELSEKNQMIDILNEKINKLNNHIQNCENEILRREDRELSLLDEYENTKKQMHIYLQRMELLHSEVVTLKSDNETIVKSMTSPIQKYPPKSSAKCKLCETLQKEREEMEKEIREGQTIRLKLQKDIDCLIQTVFS